MEKVELTIEQKMELAIAKAKEVRKQAKDQAKLALLNNNKYVDYLATIEDEKDQIDHLNAIIEQLNNMKAITTTDGTNYNVNIYPVAEYAFGPIMSRVVGIIVGSSAMFTDERQATFEAITNVSYLAVTNARQALGSPAYYSKGQFVEAIQTNIDEVETTLTAVCSALSVDVTYVNKVNALSIARWFKVSEAKAEKQYTEYKKIESVDSENNFTLED